MQKGFLGHLNTDATYRTRRLRVRGAVNGFIEKSGSQEKNHVSVGTVIGFTGKNHVSVGAVIGFGLNSQNLEFDVDVVLSDWKSKITSRLNLVSTANTRFQIQKRSTMRVTMSLQSQRSNLCWKIFYCQFSRIF